MRRWLMWSLLALILGAGCAFQGEVDPELMSRYERAMAGRNGQPTSGRDVTLANLPASSQELLGELTVSEDTATGRRLVPMTLEEAVRRGLAANLDILVTQYDPAIDRQEMIQAQAEFDMIVFGGANMQIGDQQTNPLFGTGQIGQSDTRTFELGVRQRSTLGTQWQLAWTMQRTWDDADFRTINTRHEPSLELQIQQPLLRDAWPEFNTAQIRITKLNRDVSEAQFRQTVEETISDVVNAYWTLYRLREEVAIQEWLAEETRRTNEITQLRKDARPNIEKKQTEVAVYERRVQLIQLQKAARDAQDQLARLLGFVQSRSQDPDIVILPVSDPAIAPVDIDRVDQLLTALKYSPVLAQARLGIALANVNVQVAENQVLPRLDLTYTGSFNGLAHNHHESMENLGTLDYFGYSLGLTFEYPLGNRAATASLRQRRLERLKAITTLQNTVDQLTAVLNERIRQIESSHAIWQAQKQTVESLEGLVRGTESLVREKAMSLSNLQLLLDAQARLGEARRLLIQAIVDYNIALVELARTTGTVLDNYAIDIAWPTPLDERSWLDAPASMALPDPADAPGAQTPEPAPMPEPDEPGEPVDQDEPAPVEVPPLPEPDDDDLGPADIVIPGSEEDLTAPPDDPEPMPLPDAPDEP